MISILLKLHYITILNLFTTESTRMKISTPVFFMTKMYSVIKQNWLFSKSVNLNSSFFPL